MKRVIPVMPVNVHIELSQEYRTYCTPFSVFLARVNSQALGRNSSEYITSLRRGELGRPILSVYCTLDPFDETLGIATTA